MGDSFISRNQHVVCPSLPWPRQGAPGRLERDSMTGVFTCTTNTRRSMHRHARKQLLKNDMKHFGEHFATQLLGGKKCSRTRKQADHHPDGFICSVTEFTQVQVTGGTMSLLPWPAALQVHFPHEEEP